MAKKPIKVTEVVLRDAHQSLLATRMTMDEMRPILPEMDKIPYFSVECWGGATFDSCIRFLDEDPWERLRILRKELPHQKLQMLFRGQNMLGYRPYADDAVEYFVQKSVANGIDVIRIFDALNDPRNLQTAIKAANKEGAHVQACISYTLSPVHNNEYFANYAKTLEEMGADSICIKDMAGLLKPYTCYELVSELKKTVKIPVDIHSHYTAGTDQIKGFCNKIIVDHKMMPVISAVTDLIRSKRNIAYHTVEKAVWITGFLKSLYCNPVLLVKLLCNSTRDRIDLYAVEFSLFLFTFGHCTEKDTGSHGWLQYVSFFQTEMCERFVYCPCNFRVRIKSIIYACPCIGVFLVCKHFLQLGVFLFPAFCIFVKCLWDSIPSGIF